MENTNSKKAAWWIDAKRLGYESLIDQPYAAKIILPTLRHAPSCAKTSPESRSSSRNFDNMKTPKD